MHPATYSTVVTVSNVSTTRACILESLKVLPGDENVINLLSVAIAGVSPCVVVPFVEEASDCGKPMGVKEGA